MDKKISTIIFVGLVVAVVGAIFYLENKKASGNLGGRIDQEVQTAEVLSDSAEEKSKKYEVAKEIVAPADFVNTDDDGITIQELVGKKVILVDFWTYSCINCQRTMPYLTSWYEKYKNSGLEIIGVHTPEFEFEKEIENVTSAVEQWGIEYPVVLDNDYGTWRNYKNRYWPRKYLIDIDGYIVYDHIGEGAYKETEKKIQELLSERMVKLNEQGEISSDIVRPENAEEVNFRIARSPETYFGSLRNEHFASGSAGLSGQRDFKEPVDPKANALYLPGRWDIQPEYAQNISPGSKIIYKFTAEKVFLVASAEQDVELTLLLDGQPVGDAAGSDVSGSKVIVNEDKLYRLIENPAGHGQHTLEIIVENPGLKAFAFTFG